MDKKLIIVLFTVVFVLRLVFILQGEFIFSWDFARDLLWVRQITQKHKPILVGPWGSLDNTFFGPLFYYLLSVPMLIFQGDPRAAVFLTTCFISSMIIIGAFFIEKVSDKKSALISALFFSNLSIFTGFSLYSFSQNLIPFLFLVFFIIQWQLIKEPSPKKLFLSFFTASLFFHFEPVDVPALILITVILFYILWRKEKMGFNLKMIVLSALGFLLPFIPNVFFDLRHSFIQLKGYWNFLIGNNKSLHGQLPFLLRIKDRIRAFLTMFLRTFNFNQGIFLFLAVFFSLLLIFSNKRKGFFKNKEMVFFKLCFLNLMVFFSYFLIFPSLLKEYYLYCLPVLFVLMAGVFLNAVLRQNAFLKKTVVLLLIFIFIVNFYRVFTRNFHTSGEIKYSQQKKVVDRVYQLADGRPFKVYSYLNNIYDYPYQYLFSWYGNKRYRYIPVEYAYLPNQPEYVADKSFYDKGKKTCLSQEVSENKTFLIVEPGDNLSYLKVEWLKKFNINGKILKETILQKIDLYEI